MKFGVVVFPGSNCDHDTYHALDDVLGQETVFLWHKETRLGDVDVVVVAGGFSYGDYLRSGAIASFSPIMEPIRRHAEEGGIVLGICNGFQILQESGLLPGVMLRNTGLKFLCQYVYLKVENPNTIFSRDCPPDRPLKIPIAHNDGSFFVSDQELQRLESQKQVVFRYVAENGERTREGNPNGSAGAVAGVINPQGNVLGLMPHPERAAESILGSEDGLFILRSLIHSLQAVNV